MAKHGYPHSMIHGLLKSGPVRSLTTAVVVGCGGYLQKWVPTAHSIGGDVTAHLKHG